MSKNLAYMSSPGTLSKILNKICDANVPENFNADFLGTKLGFPGGYQKTFISWAKKSGFLNSDGTPTQIYKDFRNPAFRGATMAKALKIGYEELYTRNEYAHDLAKKDVTKVISEITGNPHDNSTVKAIVASFWNAKEFADFDAKGTQPKKESKPKETISPKKERVAPTDSSTNRLGIGLNYTINLVLPKTDDPAIYDAIFKSLKDNLLDE